MKKNIVSILWSFVLLCTASCSQNEDDNPPVFPDNAGGLNVAANMSTEQVIPVITRSADFSGLSADDFYIKILNDKGEVVKEFESLTAMRDEGLPVILSTGNYTAFASSFKPDGVEASANPYFEVEGGSHPFVIEEKRTTQVTLKCVYKSLGVELVLSEQFQELLDKESENYDYKVNVSNGEASYEFSKDEMNPAYFLKGCDELVVRVTMKMGGRDYPERVWRITNQGNAPKTGEYYIIRLDAGDQPETVSLRSALME
ncbi:DUF4493 domain-containing protein [uncultured Parabacteroides sp.]|uniref:DUF4493 domain-containing protein n=1 Tax=uncultured Parabacteroides sp. TaxID=512312 RepID=UPI00260CE61B|nr:DUF4493 domain-containing protein [uncultured Parabacteroides sp.]